MPDPSGFSNSVQDSLKYVEAVAAEKLMMILQCLYPQQKHSDEHGVIKYQSRLAYPPLDDASTSQKRLASKSLNMDSWKIIGAWDRGKPCSKLVV